MHSGQLPWTGRTLNIALAWCLPQASTDKSLDRRLFWRAPAIGQDRLADPSMAWRAASRVIDYWLHKRAFPWSVSLGLIEFVLSFLLQSIVQVQLYRVLIGSCLSLLHSFIPLYSVLFSTLEYILLYRTIIEENKASRIKERYKAKT